MLPGYPQVSQLWQLLLGPSHYSWDLMESISESSNSTTQLLPWLLSWIEKYNTYNKYDDNDDDNDGYNYDDDDDDESIDDDINGNNNTIVSLLIIIITKIIIIIIIVHHAGHKLCSSSTQVKVDGPVQPRNGQGNGPVFQSLNISTFHGLKTRNGPIIFIIYTGP